MSSRTDLYKISFDEIEISPNFNVRNDMGNLTELGDSIIANGIQVPVHGFQNRGYANGHYFLTDGHRRYFAVKQAIEEGKIDKAIFRFPLIKNRPMSIEERTLHLLTHNQGKPLSILEESIVYERLLTYGMSVQDIAARAAKSPTHVSNGLLLMTSHLSTRKMIADNIVAATLVIDMLKEGKDPAQVDRKLKYAYKKEQQKKLKLIEKQQEVSNLEQKELGAPIENVELPNMVVSESGQIKALDTTQNNNAIEPQAEVVVKITRKHVLEPKHGKMQTFTLAEMHGCYDAAILAERYKPAGGEVRSFEEYMEALKAKTHKSHAKAA